MKFLLVYIIYVKWLLFKLIVIKIGIVKKNRIFKNVFVLVYFYYVSEKSIGKILSICEYWSY